MAKHEKKNNKKTIIISIVILLLITTILLILYLRNRKQDNLLNNIDINQNQLTEEKTERMLQVEELKKENEEIIGWLEVEGTNISYPVLQNSDNEYYMTHTYNKKYSKDGSIFLDKDYNWDLPSSNLLIYGHNNLDGVMFSDLLKYKDESYYKDHLKIRFTTNKEDAEYEIIAVFYSRVYYKSEKNVFRYYYFINAENENQYNEYVNNCKKASLYDTGKTAQYGEQLMTLSTCSYHTKDGRFAVVAKRIN
jgi:sortase B